MIKKLIFFLLIVLVSHVNCIDDFPTKAELLPCLKEKFDLNSDNQITITELDTVFSTIEPSVGMPPLFWRNGTKIMEKCDINSDGVLTEADWEGNNCFNEYNRGVRSVLKQTCNLLNYTFI